MHCFQYSQRMDPKSSALDSSNAAPAGGIPGWRRLRIAILVAVAVVIGGAVAGIVVWRSQGTSTPAAALTRVKPLTGQPPIAVDLPGPALTHTTPAGVLAAAIHRLPAGDVRIAVAKAMSGYLRNGPRVTIAALHRLPQRQASVAFNLGVAELWSGDVAGANTSLQLTRNLDAYGFYGSRADNLLYPPFPAHGAQVLPGYPPYTSPLPSTNTSVAALEKAAAGDPGNANDWLRLAVALEDTDRVAAIAAARRALADDPNGVSPQVAVAVLSFDKANHATAVGTVATLASRLPRNAEIRFNLGMLFFWILRKGDAASEFRQVVLDDPHGPYARFAGVFTSCLTNGCPDLLKSGASTAGG